MESVWLSLIGLVAGLAGGMLGIGGSIVMIPAMTELLGPQQHLFQATALIVNFFVGAPALVQHFRADAVSKSTLRLLIPAAVCGAVLGVLCSELPLFRAGGAIYLTGLFGLFLFAAAGRDIVALIRLPRNDVTDSTVSRPRNASNWRSALLVGLPTGIISGLLGVGGGVLAVPLQRRFLHLNVRTAIANSAATIVALSVVGATVKHLTIVRHHPDIMWYAPAGLAILLIPTAIVGASIGGRLTHMVPTRSVRVAFVLLLAAAGFRMVSRTIQAMNV